MSMFTTPIKANKKRIIYISFVILFLIVMVFLNEIVARSAGIDVKKNQITGLEIKNEVDFSIEDIKSYGDIAETIHIEGWALCETEEENLEKKISLIFSSPKERYEISFSKAETIEGNLFIRPDVKEAYPGAYGMEHGFIGNFSTVAMKKGTYKLYIYCWENENSYGIIDTGKVFIKENSSFKELI